MFHLITQMLLKEESIHQKYQNMINGIGNNGLVLNH